MATAKEKDQIDVLVLNHGSVFLVHPHTERAKHWLGTNVALDAPYFGGNLVVEHRFIADLVDGMALHGLKVG
jgi:hypothetical protein